MNNTQEKKTKAEKYFYENCNFKSVFNLNYPLHYNTKKVLVRFSKEGLIDLTENEINQFLKNHRNTKEYKNFNAYTFCVNLDDIRDKDRKVDIFNYKFSVQFFQKKLNKYLNKKAVEFFYDKDQFVLADVMKKCIPLSKNTRDYFFELQEKGVIKVSKNKIIYFLKYHCSQRRYLQNCCRMQKRINLKESNINISKTLKKQKDAYSYLNNKNFVFDELKQNEMIYSYKKHEEKFNFNRR